MRSFITSLKSLGPETVPCGVPAPTIVVLDIGNRVSLEKVDKFCYLLDPDGGCDSAVTTRVSIVYASYLGEKCNCSIISYAQMHITISLLTVVINMLKGLCRFDYQ